MSESAAEEYGLLPGEDRSLAPAEDARHWVIVYQELIEFCQLMLARSELNTEDGHLRRRLSHYHLRLRRWQAISAAND
jgi:hypothetical protein